MTATGEIRNTTGLGLSPSSSSRSTGESYLFELELEDASVISKLICEMDDPDDNSIMIVDARGLRLVSTGTSQDDTKDSEDPHPAKVSLKIIYRKKGDPLKLRLTNNSNYTVNCDLREFSLPTFHTLMSLTEYEDVTDIVFHSKELYRFLSGLDLSSPFVTLILGDGRPDEMPVRFMAGMVELEINTSDDPPIIKRDLNAPTNLVLNFRYRTQLLKPAFNALKSSTTMSLRCGSSGLLIMEHFHDSQSVEYYVPREASDNI